MADRGALMEGSVTSALRKMAVPMAMGMVFMIAVNIIDAFWVGRLGTAELAAMTFTFPVVGLVINLALGLMIGTSTAVARAIGQGQQEQAARLTTHAVLLSVAFVCVVSGLGYLSQDAIFRTLGADPALIPLIREYMTVWFIGVIFLVVPVTIGGSLRATGDARTPMLVMMTGAIVNAVLDPLFIFGWGPVPALGLKGAAIATLIARVIGLFVVLAVLLRRRDLISLELPSPAQLWESVRTIGSVGVPAAITNALGPVAVALLTILVAGHGEPALAAYGIGARIDALVMMAPSSVSAALSPFIGQNWGAHLRKRVAESIQKALRFGLGWGVLGAAGLFVGAEPIARVFTRDEAVVAELLIYLRTVPVGYAFLAAAAIASSTFNAVDRAVRSTLLSLLRSLILAVPFAWIGSQVDDLRGLFLGIVIASVVASLFGVRWLRTLVDPEGHMTAELGESLTADALPEALRGPMASVLELEGVSLHRVRGNLLGFFVGQRELGHLHDERLDLPLPVEVGDNLSRLGMTAPHPLHEDNGWYTSAAEPEQLAWLLKMVHLLHQLSVRGDGDPITQAEMAAFTHTPRCVEALTAAAKRLEEA